MPIAGLKLYIKFEFCKKNSYKILKYMFFYKVKQKCFKKTYSKFLCVLLKIIEVIEIEKVAW
jgi:hypothetical protein